MEAAVEQMRSERIRQSKGQADALLEVARKILVEQALAIATPDEGASVLRMLQAIDAARAEVVR